MIKLVCKKAKGAHWGFILEEGKEYEGRIITKSTEIITDVDKYWKYTEKVASSRDWIKKGYTQETLHEVIPEYKTLSEINDLYTKRINMPFIHILCSDNMYNDYCLLTDEELYALGADINKDGNKKGEPAFSYTVHRVDEYFDYTPIRRDNILSQLGF
jgi:hypothetical protein